MLQQSKILAQKTECKNGNIKKSAGVIELKPLCNHVILYVYTENYRQLTIKALKEAYKLFFRNMRKIYPQTV